jgi:hypothetical protein
MGSGSDLALRIVALDGRDPQTHGLWVNYAASTDERSIVAGDSLVVWGAVAGRRTYQSVLGSDISLPEINARAVRVTDDTTSASSTTAASARPPSTSRARPPRALAEPRSAVRQDQPPPNALDQVFTLEEKRALLVALSDLTPSFEAYLVMRLYGAASAEELETLHNAPLATKVERIAQLANQSLDNYVDQEVWLAQQLGLSRTIAGKMLAYRGDAASDQE